MSDFLVSLNQAFSGAELVKQMQALYPSPGPKGTAFEFPWGKVAVLEERFGKNHFERDGTLLAWVGDPLIRFSDEFIDSLVRFHRELQRVGESEGKRLVSQPVLGQLNGSFAFAIADLRSVTLITDLMNYVQVYAATDSAGEVCSAGTHPDLVARVGGQNHDLDFTSMGEFLNAGTPLFPNTVYSRVKELSPASIYAVDSSEPGKQTRRFEYWTPPREVREGYNERAAVEELRELLLAMVRDRCQVNKVGVFLSGGLDSRLIMAAVPRDVECVGLTFANNPNRETRIAQRVADCYQRQWVPLIRDPEYLANCLLDSVKLTGCEYEWTCAQVIGVADALRPLNLDVLLEGTLFNDYFTGFCAREWQMQKRWGGLLPSTYRKTDWDFRTQISAFWREHLAGELLGRMQARRQATYDALADPQRGSVAEWLEIHPFTQDPTVGYYPAERRRLPVRLVAMDRRALEFSFRCPIELKVGGRLYHRAITGIYGRGRHIPNASDGVRPGSGHWSRLFQRGVHELKRRRTRLLTRLRGRVHVPHSWHHYQHYWRTSPKLRDLCAEYGANLDEFDGLLPAGRGRELLAQRELHWEYGFRLLQLAVWRKLTRQVTASDLAGKETR